MIGKRVGVVITNQSAVEHLLGVILLFLLIYCLRLASFLLCGIGQILVSAGGTVRL